MVEEDFNNVGDWVMKASLVMKVCRFCKQILSMFKTFVTRDTFIAPSLTLEGDGNERFAYDNSYRVKD